MIQVFAFYLFAVLVVGSGVMTIASRDVWSEVRDATISLLGGVTFADLAARAFEFDQQATVEAKGKAGGVACRRLVRALSLMKPRGIGGLRRAFVGRDRELRMVKELFHATAEERRARLVIRFNGDPDDLLERFERARRHQRPPRRRPPPRPGWPARF